MKHDFASAGTLRRYSEDRLRIRQDTREAVRALDNQCGPQNWQEVLLEDPTHSILKDQLDQVNPVKTAIGRQRLGPIERVHAIDVGPRAAIIRILAAPRPAETIRFAVI